MKKIGLFYFSGTGNTQYLAERFLEKFEKKEIKTELFDIAKIIRDKEFFEKIELYETIGILNPIYGGNAPEIVYDFINMLTDGKDKKVFYIKNGGSLFLNGGTNKNIRNALRKRGYNLFYEEQFIMPANSMRYDEENLIKEICNAAKIKCEIVVSEILDNKRKKQNESFLTILISFLMGIAEKNSIKIFVSGLTVNEKCVKCGMCIKNCPMKNITIENEKIVFGDKCLMCLKCIYFCPKNAIRATKQTTNGFVLEKFYNINKIMLNDKIKADYFEKNIGKFENLRKKIYDYKK